MDRRVDSLSCLFSEEISASESTSYVLRCIFISGSILKSIVSVLVHDVKAGFELKVFLNQL